MADPERELRCDIVEVGRRLYARGLIGGNEGNVSVRRGDTLFVTPAGVCKGFLTPDMIVRTDLEGRAQIEGEFADQTVGIEGIRSEIAMMRTPDGHGRIELTKYHRPIALPADPPGSVLMRGGSSIVGPLGQVLAGPNFEGECILTAEIDPGEIARGKYDFDVAGHYARPDVFRLSVNESAQAPVVYQSEPFAR